MTRAKRRYPVGAEVQDGVVQLRVWAAGRQRVEVVEREAGTQRALRTAALEPEGAGYFGGSASFLEPGSLYSFRLDGGETLYPDPASRFQPEGPHGPSQVVDATHHWSDGDWHGFPGRGQVLYELHVGTFTPEGTYAAAAEQLPALVRLGVTVVELMPLAEFPGRFGWGYDGVDLWAPTRLYGRPSDLRRFVARAHEIGLGVILDVVYNHLGPDGNYLASFSPHYFTDRYPNEWGQAIDFDGETSAPVREFFVENAGYWIEEFHMDGLRLDAANTIHDASECHVVAAITDRVARAAESLGRRAFVVAENESQHARFVRPRAAGGYGCDAVWNDDFHHSARVALTGRREAYYTDYAGTPQELVSATRWGYLYQGQHYAWQGKRRGAPALDLDATQFVHYLQNHDQVANSMRGARLHQLTSPARFRALTTLLLLAPQTPMLFQGQEFASSRPFLYFADHNPELAALVRKGRRQFLDQFPSIASVGLSELEILADPSDPATFESCKLDFGERERNAAVYALHARLLELRRRDPAFSQQREDRVSGAVLSPSAFALRFFCPTDAPVAPGEASGADDRLLVVNLGADQPIVPASEPLLAPPEGTAWRALLSSEAVEYGGSGHGEPCVEGAWRLPAEAAVVLAPSREAL